jgi:hypothetical protein
LTIELKSGETPGYNPVADLVGYIRRLNRKSRTQDQLFEKSNLMQDRRQRSKHNGAKQRSSELSELAQEAMSLAMLYPRYKSVVGMLFSPVLAVFKAPELLDMGGGSGDHGRYISLDIMLLGSTTIRSVESIS